MSLRDRQCGDVLALMTAYLEHSMPVEDVTMLETHMVYCPGCSGFMAQLRATVEALHELPIPPISDDERDQIVAAFRAAAGRPGAR